MKSNKTSLKAFVTVVVGIMVSSHSYAQWTQKGVDLDGQAADDRFGYSVSLSSDGNTMAAGATFNDGPGSNSGHVRVFEWNATITAWGQKGGDLNGEASGDNFGWAVSLSADGNKVAIGAPKNDQTAFSSGHIRVFEWNAPTNSWVQQGLDIDGAAADDQFGWSVSLSGDGNTLVGGARYNDGAGTHSGHARIYEWNPSTNTWDQKGADINGEMANDYFGFATSISDNGSIVAISATNHDAIGHTKIYQWNTSTNSWAQLGTNIEGDPTDELFGYAISLTEDGYTVAIGSKGNCSTGYNAGHTRIYEWNASSWGQKGGAINGESAWDLSGYSVSLNGIGNSVAVGALYNDGNGSDSGHTRVFDWDNGTNVWMQRGTDIDGEATEDHFGWSVSLSSDGATVAAGANANDDSGANSGHVRVYEYPLSTGISNDDNVVFTNVFPNPSNGTFKIEVGVQGEFYIQIIDVTGKIVLDKQVISSGEPIEINARQLEKGTYMIVIDNYITRISSTWIKN